MVKGANLAEDSPDDDSDLGRTRTATGHRERPDDDSDLGRTRTATGHRKRPDDDIPSCCYSSLKL